MLSAWLKESWIAPSLGSLIDAGAPINRIASSAELTEIDPDQFSKTSPEAATQLRPQNSALVCPVPGAARTGHIR
jgi:hypothetical protein